MDLIAAGEEFYAAMKRSTNGGGENSPMLEGEDDFYELFLQGCDVYPCLKIFTTQNVRSIFRQGFYLLNHINILLQHRKLHPSDLQHSAVKVFHIEILSKSFLFGSAQIQKT